MLRCCARIEASLRVLEMRDRLQDPARGIDQREIAGRVDSLGRTQPAVLHGFHAVVESGLARGQHGHEEARVEALGQSGWREPVGAVRQSVDGQPQPQHLANVRQPLATVAGRLAQLAAHAPPDCRAAPSARVS
jgi:hypothetical protein